MSSAAVRAPKAIKEDRRRALVLAAFGQIAERGFEGLRTREVAAEAGCVPKAVMVGSAWTAALLLVPIAAGALP